MACVRYGRAQLSPANRNLTSTGLWSESANWTARLSGIGYKAVFNVGGDRGGFINSAATPTQD